MGERDASGEGFKLEVGTLGLELLQIHQMMFDFTDEGVVNYICCHYSTFK